MECNRDEANRAKTIAELKLEKKDFLGAKKFALKAQALYPGLEGLPQMLTTLDVYTSAENKMSGEVDWYGVLGVTPSADDETIRKQYRKLALALHPDKNKSIGADGAFKLISEAWTLLSDKAKRLAYNQKRSLKAFQQTGGPSVSRTSGHHQYTNSKTAATKIHNNISRSSSASVQPPSARRTDTFWTICHRCKMHYEYLKVYLNQTLLCPNCHKAFVATETAPPLLSSSKPSNTSSNQRHQNIRDHAANGNSFSSGRYAAADKKSGRVQGGLNSFSYAKFCEDPQATVGGAGSIDPSIAAKAANVVHQAQEKIKRERDNSHAGAGWNGSEIFGSLHKADAPSKKFRPDDGYCYGANMSNCSALGRGGSGISITAGARRSGFPGAYGMPNSTRELSQPELRNMLMGKARKEIIKKLNEWRSDSETRSSVASVRKGKVKDRKVKDQNKEHYVDTSSNYTYIKDPAEASMAVPDPDFHNFDRDRAERSFSENQVWAAYDNDDGMPRFYALINKVISRRPFKVRISWLNSKTNSEFGPINWVASGFYKTCGEFRIGRHEICSSINGFSKKVKWSKGPRGTVHIFPRKGDVWALYKNWAPDWNQDTPDDVIHKYDMVLVLDDYDEEKGVAVAPLLKVSGFRTVFHPQCDSENVRRIPKEEMFRFSHQVPSHLLTGEEAKNSPKGCLELDPAATPLELLQVITENRSVPAVQVFGGIKEEVSQTVPEDR